MKALFYLDINAFKNPVLNLTPGYADNLALPLALLLFKTFLPLLFCILFLNPWSFFLFLLFGWYVLLVISYPFFRVFKKVIVFCKYYIQYSKKSQVLSRLYLNFNLYCIYNYFYVLSKKLYLIYLVIIDFDLWTTPAFRSGSFLGSTCFC